MQEIDFLPSEYHHTRQQRESVPWRIVVVAAFASIVGFAAIGQYHQRQRLQSRIDALDPQQVAIQNEMTRMAQLQDQLEVVDADAELYTYLRHPWPRTQILKALLPPISEKITFEEVVIRHETLLTNTHPYQRNRTDRNTKETKQADLRPAERDLNQLKEECDTRMTVVILTGTASESSVLHQYFDELGEHNLFQKIELSEIKTHVVEGREYTHFNATLTVFPGYGQPGAIAQKTI